MQRKLLVMEGSVLELVFIARWHVGAQLLAQVPDRATFSLLVHCFWLCAVGGAVPH